MQVRVGIVAPRQSQAVFAACAGKLSGVESRWLLYGSDDEIAALVAGAREEVDALFFAGPLALDRGAGGLPPALPVTVARLQAVDLALALLRAREGGLPLGPVSIDTFDRSTVDEVFAEVGADAMPLARPFRSADTSASLIDFHMTALAKGARYAITGRSAVYAALKDHPGITVIRSVPVPSTISAALNEAALRAVSLRHSQLRFSAALFKILGDGNMFDREVSRLSVSRILHESPGLEDAWVEDRGDRTLVVFAHKGLMERITNTWTTVPVLDEARARFGVEMAVGFGVADSARRTVHHAELALRRAEAEPGSCGFLFTDEGLAIGPMHAAGPALPHAFKTETDDLAALARRVGLGITTLSRLQEFERRLAGATTSADEISAALQVSSPSGRRIIRALVAADLAHPVGIAQPTRRGRPKRLYRLRLQDPIEKEGEAG